MIFVMILVAFGCGVIWGFSAGVNHCEKYHHDDSDDGPNYYRSGKL